MIRSSVLLLFVFAACTPAYGPVGSVPADRESSLFFKEVQKRRKSGSANYFPAADWETAKPSPDQISDKAFALMEAKLFPDHTPESEKSRKGIRTDALLVIRKGRIIYERYARGYGRTVPHLTWSISKTVAQTLIGIAEKEGLLHADDPVHHYLDYFNKPGYKDITIRHLLMMSSGIRWIEGYEANPVNSDVVNMLYAHGAADMAAYTASRPMHHKPGEYWYYSSGDTNVLMAVLKSAVEKSKPEKDAYNDYPWEVLFEPLGITSAVFEQDKAGTFVGSSYVYMTARDLARFAWLWMNGGRWMDKEILNEKWVRESTSMVESFYKTPYRREMLEDNPGWQIFLNLGDSSRSIPRPFPSIPEDAVIMAGHWGQTVIVIPSQDTIYIRFGDDRDGSLTRKDLTEMLTEAFPYRPETIRSGEK